MIGLLGSNARGQSDWVLGRSPRTGFSEFRAISRAALRFRAIFRSPLRAIQVSTDAMVKSLRQKASRVDDGGGAVLGFVLKDIYVSSCPAGDGGRPPCRRQALRATVEFRVFRAKRRRSPGISGCYQPPLTSALGFGSFRTPRRDPRARGRDQGGQGSLVSVAPSATMPTTVATGKASSIRGFAPHRNLR